MLWLNTRSRRSSAKTGRALDEQVAVANTTASIEQAFLTDDETFQMRFELRNFLASMDLS